MIIYKDLFTGDEVLTDTYKINKDIPGIYKIEAKLVEEKTEVSDAAIGGNASAEEAAEQADDAVQRGINIVLAHRLVEFEMKKKDYMTHIKDYMKRVKENLEENNPDAVGDFQKDCQAFVKAQIGEFKEWVFYCGESMQPDGMLIMCKWEGETPCMYYFKHGLEEEKV